MKRVPEQDLRPQVPGQREAGAPGNGGDGGAAVRGAGQQPAEGMVIGPAFAYAPVSQRHR